MDVRGWLLFIALLYSFQSVCLCIIHSIIPNKVLSNAGFCERCLHDNQGLEFDSSLIGAVYDRFGEKVTMKSSGEDKFVASVKVQLSPTFWGWLFQFAGRMIIISPKELIAEYKNLADNVICQ